MDSIRHGINVVDDGKWVSEACSSEGENVLLESGGYAYFLQHILRLGFRPNQLCVLMFEETHPYPEQACTNVNLQPVGKPQSKLTFSL